MLINNVELSIDITESTYNFWIIEDFGRRLICSLEVIPKSDEHFID